MREFKLEKEKKFLYGISLGDVICSLALIDRPDYLSGAILTVQWLANLEAINPSKT